jgi:hypothetical protein
MISLALRVAAIIALSISITYFAANEFWITGNDVGRNLATMVSYIIFIGVLFFGVKTIRNTHYSEGATYGQMFYVGVVVSVFTAIGIGIFTIVYFQFVRPDFQELIIPSIERSMMEQKASAEEIKKELELLRSGYSISSAFGGAVVHTVLVMLIISAVSASILRTKDTFTSEGPVNFGKN